MKTLTDEIAKQFPVLDWVALTIGNGTRAILMVLPTSGNMHTVQWPMGERDDQKIIGMMRHAIAKDRLVEESCRLASES